MHAYILYDAKSPHNVPSAVEKFTRRFGDRVIGLGQNEGGWAPREVGAALTKHAIAYVYIIKFGGPDGPDVRPFSVPGTRTLPLLPTEAHALAAPEFPNKRLDWWQASSSMLSLTAAYPMETSSRGSRLACRDRCPVCHTSSADVWAAMDQIFGANSKSQWRRLYLEDTGVVTSLTSWRHGRLLYRCANVHPPAYGRNCGHGIGDRHLCGPKGSHASNAGGC